MSFRSTLLGLLATVPLALPAAAQELPQLRVAFPEDADAMDPTTGRAYVQRVALLNMARMGRFSSDETIRGYARDIWGVPVT